MPLYVRAVEIIHKVSKREDFFFRTHFLTFSFIPVSLFLFPLLFLFSASPFHPSLLHISHAFSSVSRFCPRLSLSLHSRSLYLLFSSFPLSLSLQFPIPPFSLSSLSISLPSLSLSHPFTPFSLSSHHVFPYFFPLLPPLSS